MSNKKLISKVFVNKKTNQLSIFPSKKEIKKIDPSIKFGEELFVKLQIFNKRKKQ